MKRFGSFLIGLGFVIGAILVLGMIMGIRVGGMPLLTAIGLGKLSFLVAASVMAVGAFMRRLGIRNERRALDPHVAQQPHPVGAEDLFDPRR